MIFCIPKNIVINEFSINLKNVNIFSYANIYKKNNNNGICTAFHTAIVKCNDSQPLVIGGAPKQNIITQFGDPYITIPITKNRF
jgi:hypothetical protein